MSRNILSISCCISLVVALVWELVNDASRSSGTPVFSPLIYAQTGLNCQNGRTADDDASRNWGRDKSWVQARRVVQDIQLDLATSSP